jgi:predicted metal-dependent hydrolase
MINKFVQQKSAWIIEHVSKAKSQPPSLLHGGTRADYARLKTKALGLAEARLVHFNKIYKLTYKKVSIRNQKTRWGSCTSNGALSFNYRIVHLTPEQVDYIIVHELCHLAQMNHSIKFWRLVEKTIPEHKRIRATIRNAK